MATNRLQEEIKPACVLEPTTVDTSTDDQESLRVKLSDYRQALFCVLLEYADGDLDEGQEVGVSLRQSTAASGGDVEDIVEETPVVGGVKARKALVDVTNCDSGTITINDVEFEVGTYDATTAPLEFADGAELETAINGQDMGIDVDRNGEKLTLTSEMPGALTITVEEDVSHADTYACTLEAEVLMEAYRPAMDSDKSYAFVNINNDMTEQADGNATASVYVILGLPYGLPVSQAVAVQK